MTLTPWDLLSILLVPALLGVALLRWQGVTPRTDPLAFGGWAWIQGCLGLAVVLSAWLWFGLPLRASLLAPVVLALAAVLFALGRQVPVAVRAATAPHPRWERWLFAAALVFLVVTTGDRILLAAKDVLATSDEARIWAAKAKVMFHTGTFGPAFRAAARVPEIVAHADYPPLNPLLQVWVHAHAGQIVHVEARLPVQAFGVALLLVLASALRRRSRPLVAALFLLCLGSLGRFFTYQVFSDALVATGLFVSWDLWQRYGEDRDPVWLRLLGCCAPLLPWSKNEGMLHLLAFVMAIGLALALRRQAPFDRRALTHRLRWAWPLVLSVLYLVGFNAYFGLENDLVRGATQELFLQETAGKVVLITQHFAELIVLLPVSTNYLLLAFLVLLVLCPRTAFAPTRIVFTLGLCLALCGYMATYLSSHWDLAQHLKHSAHRLVYQLAPATGLWLLLFVVEVLPGLSAASSAPPDSLGSRPSP